MSTIYTVIDGVYDFTVGRTIGYVQAYLDLGTITEDVQHVHGDSQETSPADPLDSDEETAPETFKTLSTILESRTEVGSTTHTIAYTNIAETPLFLMPTKEFDTVVQTIPYGSMVLILEERGRFSRVSYGSGEGWIARDALADRAAHVYPQFTIGEEQAYNNANTIRLRSFIKDEFRGGEVECSLQAGEYVLYKLMRHGSAIPWGSERPRIPGRWHQMLKGASEVRISTEPAQGSVMECILKDDIGHLAFVEAVFPDESITISEVNYPDRGIYNERTLTREGWQTLGAVFIKVD